MKLIKNALVFTRNPETGYLEASQYEIRAGAEIEVTFGRTEVQMPNGAICEKTVAYFEEPWSRRIVYLLVDELGQPELAERAVVHQVA